MDILTSNLITVLIDNSDTLYAKIVLANPDPGKSSDGWFVKALPVIGVLVGAVVTISGQLFFKYLEQRLARQREINSIKQVMNLNVNLMHFILKDIAYLRVDSCLQYYYSQFDENEAVRIKALNENYSNYNHLSAKEAQLSKLYSEIYSGLISYYSLMKVKFPEKMTAIFETLRMKLLDLEKSVHFLEDCDPDAEGDLEVKRLTLVYLSIISDLEKEIKML